jgi:hypothetical protein
MRKFANAPLHPVPMPIWQSSASARIWNPCLISVFRYKFPRRVTIESVSQLTRICLKIKNPPPVELCWQKKEIPRRSLLCLGWLNLPPKFDIELLSLFT